MGIESNESGSKDFSFSESEAANNELNESLEEIKQALTEVEEQIDSTEAQLEAERSMLESSPDSNKDEITAEIDKLNERLSKLYSFKDQVEGIQARTIQTQDRLQASEQQLLRSILSPTTEPNPDDES